MLDQIGIDMWPSTYALCSKSLLAEVVIILAITGTFAALVRVALAHRVLWRLTITIVPPVPVTRPEEDTVFTDAVLALIGIVWLTSFPIRVRERLIAFVPMIAVIVGRVVGQVGAANPDVVASKAARLSNSNSGLPD